MRKDRRDLAELNYPPRKLPACGADDQKRRSSVRVAEVKRQRAGAVRAERTEMGRSSQRSPMHGRVRRERSRDGMGRCRKTEGRDDVLKRVHGFGARMRWKP